MTRQATFFSQLIIALKEDDVPFFRYHFLQMSKENRHQLINSTHQPQRLFKMVKSGFTPLAYAAYYHRNDFIPLLINDFGADPHTLTHTHPSQHPANIALARQNFDGFELCLKNANPQRLIQQQRNKKKSSIHVLMSLIDSQFTQKPVTLALLSITKKILFYSHQDDIQDFILFLDSVDNINANNRNLLRRFAHSAINRKSQSVTPATTQTEAKLSLPLLATPHQTTRCRALSDTQHAKKRLENNKIIPRSQSLDMLPYTKPTPLYIPPAQILPAVEAKVFIQQFQSKFMRYYLDALLSLDISNFSTSGETVYSSVKETVDNLTGISSVVADSVMSVVGASKHASICATVRKAAKLLIMSEGPSGLNENNCYEEEPQEGPPLAALLAANQDDPLDGIKLSRTKQARMNHISFLLATQILSGQTTLCSLNYDAMMVRIDIMIEKIFKYISSDCFNPMVAGFNNEIHAIVDQLYHGYLEPADPGNKAQQLLNRRNLKNKQCQFGYYYDDPHSAIMRYFVPSKTLSKKHLYVAYFNPLPPSINLKHFPEATTEQVVTMTQQSVAASILDKLKSHPNFHYAHLAKTQSKQLHSFLIRYFKDDFTTALFVPEKNDHYRRQLIHIISEVIAQYAYIVTKPRKICALTLFQKKLGPKRFLYINYTQSTSASKSLLSLMNRLQIECQHHPELKSFSIQALSQSPKALNQPRQSRFSFPKLTTVCPYQPLTQSTTVDKQHIQSPLSTALPILTQ